MYILVRTYLLRRRSTSASTHLYDSKSENCGKRVERRFISGPVSSFFRIHAGIIAGGHFGGGRWRRRSRKWRIIVRFTGVAGRWIISSSTHRVAVDCWLLIPAPRTLQTTARPRARLPLPVQVRVRIQIQVPSTEYAFLYPFDDYSPANETNHEPYT